jgi:hypothetical protein
MPTPKASTGDGGFSDIFEEKVDGFLTALTVGLE